MVAKYGVNGVDVRRGARFNLVFRDEGVKSRCHPSPEHDALISSSLSILFLVRALRLFIYSPVKLYTVCVKQRSVSSHVL